MDSAPTTAPTNCEHRRIKRNGGPGGLDGVWACKACGLEGSWVEMFSESILRFHATPEQLAAPRGDR